MRAGRQRGVRLKAVGRGAVERGAPGQAWTGAQGGAPRARERGCLVSRLSKTVEFDSYRAENLMLMEPSITGQHWAFRKQNGRTRRAEHASPGGGNEKFHWGWRPPHR